MAQDVTPSQVTLPCWDNSCQHLSPQPCQAGLVGATNTPTYLHLSTLVSNVAAIVQRGPCFLLVDDLKSSSQNMLARGLLSLALLPHDGAS